MLSTAISLRLKLPVSAASVLLSSSIERCGKMIAGARLGCYEWLGTALAVVTNGRFEEGACPFISRAGRSACLTGARRMNEALVTFS